uniref:Putative baseplate protein n=1 Tax=viral metagenome TaxID=1070528 RepID=A0A6M3J3B0_9ZZZZ
MFFPGQNQLQKPTAVAVPAYEQILSRFKAVIVDHISKTDPALAAEVALTLENEAEITTKLVEASSVFVQTFAQDINEQALQMFAYWATGSNMDAKASDFGLARQVITPGDDTVFPPVEPVYEDDESLKLRYYLAPYGWSTAGSRLAYKFQAMTLDAKPTITVDRPNAQQIVVTYTLGPGTFASQVKDAAAERTEPGTVNLTLQAWDGNGVPSDELMAAAERHFARDDVAVATDLVTFEKAEPVPYEISGIAYINPGPDSMLTKAAAEAALLAYTQRVQRLGGVVELDMLKHHLILAGGIKPEISAPVADIECSRRQTPLCTGINIEVRTL